MGGGGGMSIPGQAQSGETMFSIFMKFQEVLMVIVMGKLGSGTSRMLKMMHGVTKLCAAY